MKKIYEKIASNKITLSIALLVMTVLFMFITTGFGGIIPGWPGIVNIITQFIKDGINYTSNGYSALGEIVWFVSVIPLILLFKNKYVFTQKKEGFFKSLKLVWIDLGACLAFLILSVMTVGITNINFKEAAAMFTLYLFVGLFEELLCRGWILNELLERFGNTRKNVLFSIFMSATIFGVIHIVNFFGGRELFGTILQIINAINGGIVFAALYYRTKNIWACVTLHTIWDFAISLQEVNQSVICADLPVTVEFTMVNAIASSIVITFIIIPEVLNWLLLINKKDMNEILPEKNKEELTQAQIKRNNSYKLVITIIASVYLVLFIGFFSIMGLASGLEEETCTSYPRINVENYSEEISYKKELQFTLKNYEVPEYDPYMNCGMEMNCIPSPIEVEHTYKLKINEESKLELSIDNEEKIIFNDIKDVVRVFAIKRENIVEIYALALNNDGLGIVYTTKLDNETSSKTREYLEKLETNFRHIELPGITKIGILRIEDKEYEYPLFIAQNNYDYIIGEDGNIAVFEK